MEFAKDVHVYHQDLALMGLNIGCRMVAIRDAATGHIWLHSPNRFSDELMAQVDSLGPVKWIVSPNAFHHLYAKAWLEAYPDAKHVAARSLEQKRPDLRFDHFLDEPLPPSWTESIKACPLEGIPVVDETVFFHEPTRTLIACDLIFNFTDTRGKMTLFAKLWGAHNKPGVSPILRILTKDKERREASIRAMCGLGPEGIILSHGALVKTGAQDVLAKAYRVRNWPASV